MRGKRISLGWKIAIGLVCLGALLAIVSFFREKPSIEVIRSVEVERGDLSVKISATGEVKPQNRVAVKPPIEGRIEEVLVEEGEEVRRGQILAWMSSTERAALLDAARAQGQEAYERWKNTYKPAPLISPVDGMVIVRAVEPGQTVMPGDPVAVIADLLIVEALVDETDLSLISPGQDVTIILDAYPDRVIQGTVDHISYESKLVNNVNVYTVDLLPGEVPPMFRSGMTATVTFVVSKRTDVLMVPSEAISAWPPGVEKPEGAEFAMYTQTLGGKLVPVPVRIGESDGRMTEILEGVSEGDEIKVVRRSQTTGGTNPFLPFGRKRRKERER